jgi:hypothetical protein
MRRKTGKEEALMWGTDFSHKPGDKITVPEYVRSQVGSCAGREFTILGTVHAVCPSGLLGLCHYLARDLVVFEDPFHGFIWWRNEDL